MPEVDTQQPQPIDATVGNQIPLPDQDQTAPSLFQQAMNPVVQQQAPPSPPVVSQNRVTGGPQVTANGQTKPLYKDQGEVGSDPRDFHPLVQKASVLRRTAEVLAGGPRYKTVYNDDGSVTREQVPLSSKDILMAAVANTLGGVGQVASNLSNRMAGRAPQPIRPLPSQIAQQQSDQQSADDFNVRQTQILRALKVREANLTNLRLAFALGKEDDDAKQQIVRSNADDLSNWEKAGSVVASRIASNELMSRGYNPSKYVAIPDGLVPAINQDGTRTKNDDGVPLSQFSYSIVDATSQAPLSQQKYDEFAKYGLMSAKPGFQVPEGGTISSAQLALMNYKLGLIQQTQRELDEVTDAAGSPKVDLGEQIRKNPAILSAIGKFHDDGASSDPNQQIARVRGVNPNAAGIMTNLFGADNLRTYAAKTQQAPDKMSLQIAEQILSDPRTDPNSPAAQTARAMLKLDRQQAAQKTAAETTARTSAEAAASPGWAGKTDNFGSPLGGPEVDQKEFNKRYDAFSKDYIQPLNRLKKTDTELTRIMNTSNMSGAQKVTALLAAVGISGDPLQGKGFRINQAIVGEHAGARNIWESAVQRANQIIGSGGPITEKQVRDYESIARDVVHDAFVAAGGEAHRQGLPVDFLPRGGGKTIDPDTAKLYLDIAGGDKDSARKAAKADGWRF